MERLADSYLYGVMAEFDNPEALLAACNRAREAGYKRMDAYTPFPVEDLSAALGIRDKSVPLITLIGGFLGCFSGFGLLYFCTVVDYPLNIAGRPLFGWPSFLPITFELTVLFASLIGTGSMIVLNGLPMPYHPTFNVPQFERASSDRFFLCIETTDPLYHRAETTRFLEGLAPLSVSDVER